MTLVFEKPEPRLTAGGNWPVLTYLLDRFNRPELEGSIFLRRTLMGRDLQLCLAGECRGAPITVYSESFDEALILEAAKKEQLTLLVSRFLLRAKSLHGKHTAALTDPGSASAHA